RCAVLREERIASAETDCQRTRDPKNDAVAHGAISFMRVQPRRGCGWTANSATLNCTRSLVREFVNEITRLAIYLSAGSRRERHMVGAGQMCEHPEAHAQVKRDCVTLLAMTSS